MDLPYNYSKYTLHIFLYMSKHFTKFVFQTFRKCLKLNQLKQYQSVCSDAIIMHLAKHNLGPMHKFELYMKMQKCQSQWHKQHITLYMVVIEWGSQFLSPIKVFFTGLAQERAALFRQDCQYQDVSWRYVCRIKLQAVHILKLEWYRED